MNRRTRGLGILIGGLAVCLAVFFAAGPLTAQEAKKPSTGAYGAPKETAKEAAKETAKKEAAPAFTYIGSAKCKMCHMTAKSGAQYKLWQEGPHAKAFEALKTPEADEIAQAKGLKVAAAEAPECVGCHVTAPGCPAEVRGTMTNEDGVGCEACHGPGSAYQKMAVMKQLSAGEIEPASVGLIVPTEAVCKTCHNEKSPTYKPFDFETFAAKIAHPIPKPEAEEAEGAEKAEGAEEK
ncbi:MAG: cytochrome c family protein [Candidatus Eisenbacteria bacterium]